MIKDIPNYFKIIFVVLWIVYFFHFFVRVNRPENIICLVQVGLIVQTMLFEHI